MHTHIQTHTHGESQAFVVPKETLRGVFKKKFNVQGWGCLFKGGAFVWQSRVYIHKQFKVRRCSFRGGVQSNKFHCTMNHEAFDLLQGL